MTLALNIFLHVLLIGSLLLFLWVIVAGALAEPDPWERTLRLAAIVAGALVALGAQAAGVSFATFTVEALAGARAPSAGAALVSAVIPALVGVGLGFFLVRTINRSSRIARRAMGFLAMLIGVAFAALYAQITQTNGLIIGAAAIPNVSFVVGVILTVVFTWDPDARSAEGKLRALGDFVRSARSKDATQSSTLAPTRHDPFGDL